MVVEEFEGNRGNTQWGNSNLHNQPTHHHAVGGTAEFDYEHQEPQEDGVLKEFENSSQTLEEYKPVQIFSPEHQDTDTSV